MLYIVAAIWPEAATALQATHYTIGIVLGTVIGLWAGKLVGKPNYSDAAIAGIVVGLANAIPAVILFGYGWGAIPQAQAFGAIITVVSIGSAVVGNMWKS